jgi:hypothetical protein
MGHRIFAQGSLDGACCLYSIMNAFKALTFPEMETRDFASHQPAAGFGKRKWGYLVRTCPQTVEILSGVGLGEYIAGIESSRTNEALEKNFNNILAMAFDLLSDNDYRFQTSIISLGALEKVDFRTSVVILAIDKDIPTSAGNTIGKHFICIVGKDAERFHIMCSVTLSAVDSGRYVEQRDDLSKRYYNNAIKIVDVNEINLGKPVDGIFEIRRI